MSSSGSVRGIQRKPATGYGLFAVRGLSKEAIAVLHTRGTTTVGQLIAYRENELATILTGTRYDMDAIRLCLKAYDLGLRPELT